WGWEGDGLTEAELNRIDSFWAHQFGAGALEVTPPPAPDEIALRPPRIAAPSSLGDVCSTDHHERLVHSYGHSLADSIRIFRRDFRNPPDIVAFPCTEQEGVDVLDWCESAGAAAIPWGGGSSVGGGGAPPGRYDGDYKARCPIDRGRLGGVREVHSVPEAASIQPGIYGPALEEQLKPSGLTLRHFAQSFEFSTLGGWIAKRSGGHFA